jgi:uncharacterized membrane protein YkoI
MDAEVAHMKAATSLLVAGLLCAAGASAWAQTTRDDAAAAVQRQGVGRVLAVDRGDADGRPVWRVKVVTPAGDVRVLLLDVATGRTL